ncbi:MAG: methyltransferase domain-containing protein [Candidatus Kapaibacterium sp.]
MAEFWESSFKDKQTMWGFEPADSAIATVDLFQREGLQEILIPGFGYGRNAQVFTESGFNVTGIEISETAIDLAKKHYGDSLKVYHGSVGDMPFDQKMYDGIFCYALIHLLSEEERAKLIDDCYNQIRPGGYMVFVAISTNTPTYGEGVRLGRNWYQTKHGVELFYYDAESVDKEFGKYGLLEAKEIDEPVQKVENRASQRFWQIACRKEEQ